MKKIIKYKLNKGKIPDYIENGGHFPNNDDEMIGISTDNIDKTKIDNSSVLSNEELIAYIKSLNLTKEVVTELTESEKEQFAKGWIANNM